MQSQKPAPPTTIIIIITTTNTTPNTIERSETPHFLNALRLYTKESEVQKQSIHWLYI